MVKSSDVCRRNNKTLPKTLPCGTPETTSTSNSVHFDMMWSCGCIQHAWYAVVLWMYLVCLICSGRVDVFSMLDMQWSCGCIQYAWYIQWSCGCIQYAWYAVVLWMYSVCLIYAVVLWMYSVRLICSGPVDVFSTLNICSCGVRVTKPLISG